MQCEQLNQPIYKKYLDQIMKKSFIKIRRFMIVNVTNLVCYCLLLHVFISTSDHNNLP